MVIGQIPSQHREVDPTRTLKKRSVKANAAAFNRVLRGVLKPFNVEVTERRRKTFRGIPSLKEKDIETVVSPVPRGRKFTDEETIILRHVLDRPIGEREVAIKRGWLVGLERGRQNDLLADWEIGTERRRRQRSAVLKRDLMKAHEKIEALRRKKMGILPPSQRRSSPFRRRGMS